jgi:hypothetical protein
MATSANQQQAGIYLPAKQTIGNQAIKPVQNDPVKLPDQNIDPVTGRSTDQAGFGMTTTSQPTTQSATTTGANAGGLLGDISVTQPQKPASPEFNYQNGYTGLTGKTDFNYDPRSESLVQNQLTGLLDPNSPLMKRAVSQSQELAASRGLQSSSIAAGAGTGAMIDRALPIAQQDAQTYGNAQQLGWQQGFQADQNNLARQHDAAMTQEQQRFQAAMQDLQYKQQMGVLDYQGQQQLQQMERNAQLNQQRDVLLQRFNDMNMDKSFLQNLQLTQLQYQQQDSMFEKQVSAQAAMDYRNAVSTGYNYYLEQVAAVYGNPNMTPEQQAAGVAKLGQLFEQQRLQLQAIYGFAAPAQPTLPGADGSWTGNPNPNNPVTPVIPSPVSPSPQPGGGSTIPNTGGGLLDQLTRPIDNTTPINDPYMNWAIQ